MRERMGTDRERGREGERERERERELLFYAILANVFQCCLNPQGDATYRNWIVCNTWNVKFETFQPTGPTYKKIVFEILTQVNQPVEKDRQSESISLIVSIGLTRRTPACLPACQSFAFAVRHGTVWVFTPPTATDRLPRGEGGWMCVCCDLVRERMLTPPRASVQSSAFVIQGSSNSWPSQWEELVFCTLSEVLQLVSQQQNAPLYSGLIICTLCYYDVSGIASACKGGLNFLLHCQAEVNLWQLWCFEV